MLGICFASDTNETNSLNKTRLRAADYRQSQHDVMNLFYCKPIITNILIRVLGCSNL